MPSLTQLAFSMGIGLLAASADRATTLLLIACVASLVGANFFGLDTQWLIQEMLTMVSLAIVGALLVLRIRWSFAVLCTLFVIASLFHGADFANLAMSHDDIHLPPYLVGPAIIPFGVAMSACVWGRAMARRPVGDWRSRIAGAVLLSMVLVDVFDRMANPLINSTVT